MIFWTEDMIEYSTAIITFFVLIIAIHLGRGVTHVLPDEHTTDATKDAIKRGVALIVTLTALVLGLLISTGKASFDKQSESVANIVSEFAVLDEMLNHYGESANAARSDLHNGAKAVILSFWGENYEGQKSQLSKTARVENESFLDQIAKLPVTDEQSRIFKDKAVASASTLVKERFRLATIQHSAIPRPMLYIIIAWLGVIFLSLGFCSPQNDTALVSEYIGAISASAAVLLISEFDHPFTGMIRIAKEPFSFVISSLGG